MHLGSGYYPQGYAPQVFTAPPDARAEFIRNFALAKYYQEGGENNLRELLNDAAKIYDFSIGKVSV